MTAPADDERTFPSGCTGTRRRMPDGVLHLHLTYKPARPSGLQWVAIPVVLSPGAFVAWAAYHNPTALLVFVAVVVGALYVAVAVMGVAESGRAERFGTEARVTADSLHVIDRGRPRNSPIADIRSIEAAPAIGDNDPCLVVRTADEVVEEVIRYREMPELRWLADEIRAALPSQVPGPPPDLRPASDVIDYAMPPFSGERLVVHHEPDGSVEVHLRPPPLWKRRTELAIGLAATASLVVFPLVARPWTRENAIAVAIFTPLTLLVWLLLISRHRRAALGITVRAAQDGVTLTNDRPPRRWRWSDITSIDAGHDTSGEGAVTCLFIRGQDRVDITLRAYPLPELQWIARALQQSRAHFSPQHVPISQEQQGGDA